MLLRLAMAISLTWLCRWPVPSLLLVLLCWRSIPLLLSLSLTVRRHSGRRHATVRCKRIARSGWKGRSVDQTARHGRWGVDIAILRRSRLTRQPRWVRWAPRWTSILSRIAVRIVHIWRRWHGTAVLNVAAVVVGWGSPHPCSCRTASGDELRGSAVGINGSAVNLDVNAIHCVHARYPTRRPSRDGRQVRQEGQSDGLHSANKSEGQHADAEIFVCGTRCAECDQARQKNQIVRRNAPYIDI